MLVPKRLVTVKEAITKSSVVERWVEKFNFSNKCGEFLIEFRISVWFKKKNFSSKVIVQVATSLTSNVLLLLLNF